MNYNKAEFYTSFGKFSQIPKSDRLEFAFSGRSNVGKSSLINKLLNRKNLARVSSMPGKTVTINFFSRTLIRWHSHIQADQRYIYSPPKRSLL